MKKYTYLTILLLFIVFWSHAQSYYQFKGGYGFSQTKLESTENLAIEKIPTFQLGMSFRIPIAEMLYVQTELLYTRKGHLAKDTGNNLEIENKPSYMQLPLMMGVYVFSKPSFKLFLHAGPEISIGLGGDVVTTGNIESTHHIKFGYNPTENDYDPYDLGIVSGIGLEFQKINLGVSYNIGLKEVAPGSTPNLKMYNRCLHMTIGYIISDE